MKTRQHNLNATLKLHRFVCDKCRGKFEYHFYNWKLGWYTLQIHNPTYGEHAEGFVASHRPIGQNYDVGNGERADYCIRCAVLQGYSIT